MQTPNAIQRNELAKVYQVLGTVKRCKYITYELAYPDNPYNSLYCNWLRRLEYLEYTIYSRMNTLNSLRHSELTPVTETANENPNPPNPLTVNKLTHGNNLLTELTRLFVTVLEYKLMDGIPQPLGNKWFTSVNALVLEVDNLVTRSE